jgi:hypothetical protein
MTDTNRVKRWRDAKRDRGLKAVTIWLTPEEELRLKDMALQWHCSPSVVMQQALAQVSAQAPPRINTETDMAQIRELIRAEFLAMQREKATVTETVTEVVTETLARDLPVLVRQLVEGLALEALGLPATDTDYGNATDIKMSDEEVVAPEPRTGGRPRGEMRQRILTLLGEHPEGLSAEQIRAYIQPGKPLGDTLQGMRKQQKVTTRGTGKDLRYFVVS